MERLFRDFDFFSIDDRDPFHPPRKFKRDPKVVKLK
jgi:hypothetical protein